MKDAIDRVGVKFFQGRVPRKLKTAALQQASDDAEWKRFPADLDDYHTVLLDVCVRVTKEGTKKMSKRSLPSTDSAIEGSQAAKKIAVAKLSSIPPTVIQVHVGTCVVKQIFAA